MAVTLTGLVPGSAPLAGLPPALPSPAASVSFNALGRGFLALPGL